MQPESMNTTRRRFLSATGVAAASAMMATSSLADPPKVASARQLIFSSQGKTGIVDVNTLHVKYLELHAPNQATWQVAQVFPDHRRLVVLSMEPRRDGPGKPFDEYYTQTPTHLWLYDLESEQLEEICTRDRMAPFMTPALLVGEDRILVQVVKNRVGQIYSMNLDGSDAKPFTAAGEGLPYGLSLSPNGQRVAFHLASPQGYQVWTSDTLGQDRVKLAAAEGHLYFGTQWSPDGQWVLFVDCLHGGDPGHDWADVCVARADGSDRRGASDGQSSTQRVEPQVLTQNQAMWFAATYGDTRSRGGGSNVPVWTPDGKIVFPRRSPGAKVPWQYRVGQPDLDHFNREFLPEKAVGGVQLCLLDPLTNKVEELTPAEPGVWDFRGSPSYDGKLLAFCRAKTGAASELWLKDLSTGTAKAITQGIDELGADHPRWV